MKTFKLVAFQMENKKGEIVDIPLKDGLIINKENDKNTWLIELFIEETYGKAFDEFGEEDEIAVQVIITKHDNDPAFFSMKRISENRIDSFCSILLEGKLSRPPFSFAEQLLETLIEKGLTGAELLGSFQEKMRDKKNKMPKSKRTDS